MYLKTIFFLLKLVYGNTVSFCIYENHEFFPQYDRKYTIKLNIL